MNARLFNHAVAQLGRGQVDAAIETLARLLGQSPDDADAHALRALCLLRRKRLHAARLEAGTALSLEPDSVFAHRAMATEGFSGDVSASFKSSCRQWAYEH